MVDEERGIIGNGVLAEEPNPESMIICEAQVINGDAKSRVCESQVINGDDNSRVCETQANGDENVRVCDTEVTNGDENSRVRETQVINGDDNSRVCETQVANGDENARVRDTEVTNGDENSRVCETQVINGDDNSRVCENQVANGDENARVCNTEVTNGDENSRLCDTEVTNGDENLRECETHVTNGDANTRECETHVMNGDANTRECETQVANGDANSSKCETQVATGEANSREFETQATNGDANLREFETQATNGDANSREFETQATNGDANSREFETQATNGDANSIVFETQATNGDANLRECETQVTNGDANLRECEIQMANGECETQMTNSGANLIDGLRMYKRRKYLKGSAESKVLEDGKACLDSASQVSDKTTKEPVDKVFDNASSNQVLPRRESNSFMNWLGDSLLRRGRDLVLEEMSQSLCTSEGGLGECIQNARMYHPENGCPSTVKDRHCFGEGRRIFPAGHVGNGSLNDLNHHSNTELCKNVFFNILVSDKFTELCNLLFRSFHGGKLEHVLDVSVINSRMKEGAYESSPMLFHSDIQQVWTRLQNVGNEMVALGKSLSDDTMTYCEKVGASVCSTSEDGKDKHFAQDSEMLDNPEQTETRASYRVCTCRHCGEKADGGNFLVCDSCEEIYHISCINPPIEQVPLACWYCTNCVAKGAEKPHDDCALCERLNAIRSPVDGILVSEDELEEDGGQKRWARCNICKNEVKTSQKYRTCGHLHCPNKYYHDTCLTSKQLGIYASCWYCPCCLCRSCLTDKDDDKIVMCDGCDQAYHIYCMQPPCESIPEGKWFCTKCDAGIERIRRAKRAYESRQRELKGKGLQGEEGQNGTSQVDKSGGVDMLLTAAKTLNYQESMEELRKKR